MDAVSKKIEETKEYTRRAVEIRKKMIDTELRDSHIKLALNLTFGEMKRFKAGRLYEKDDEFNQLVTSINEKVINRFKNRKEFQKALVEKGIRFKDLSKKLGVSEHHIYRVVNRELVERKYELERAIEKELETKLF